MRTLQEVHGALEAASPSEPGIGDARLLAADQDADASYHGIGHRHDTPDDANKGEAVEVGQLRGTRRQQQSRWAAAGEMKEAAEPGGGCDCWCPSQAAGRGLPSSMHTARLPRTSRDKRDHLPTTVRLCMRSGCEACQTRLDIQGQARPNKPDKVAGPGQHAPGERTWPSTIIAPLNTSTKGH